MSVFDKRTKQDRWSDELEIHLRINGRTLEQEAQLITERKSILSSFMRKYVMDRYNAEKERK